MKSILQVMASGLVAALCLIILSSAGDAATRRVPSQYPTIQAGLDASAVGDTVLVAAGTYTGPGNVGLVYGKDLVLRSEGGPQETVIDVEYAQTAGFWFRYSYTRAAVLDGFTVRRGVAGSAGEIGGGAISCLGASPTVTNCILQDNGNEAIWIVGSPLISGCLIEGAGSGIVVASNARPEIVNCTIRGVGRGIDCWDESRPSIRNCVINGNYEVGVSLSGASQTELIDCEISNNALGGVAGGGGRIVGCTIANNQGYGINIGNDITVERSIIWGNCAEQGSDIFVDGARVYLNCCAWPDSGVYTIRGGQVISDGLQVKTDPRYCGPLPCPHPGQSTPGGDYSLRSDSPCLAEFSPCQAQIGYRGVGCQAPVAVGACCLGGADCVLATPQECTAQQGFYEGDGVSCYPHPCVPTAVDKVTWGRIKATFR
jgi:parallel beta-helix repeat protein